MNDDGSDTLVNARSVCTLSNVFLKVQFRLHLISFNPHSNDQAYGFSLIRFDLEVFFFLSFVTFFLSALHLGNDKC